MSKTLLRFLFLLAIPLLLAPAACSRLGAFNAVIPKDGGAKLAASGIAYGPDPRQKLDIYAPTDPASVRGVIAFNYGGSWNSGARGEYGFVGKAFASRGYVTVIFDYRLVPRFRYPVFVEDTAKAVAWTHRNIAAYGGDPRKLYVVGHSAGAYSAMMVTVAPEFLAAEGLSPSIIRATAGLSGPYDFLPLDVDETREAFKGVGNLERTQPVNRVARGQAAPPILLLHGEADDLVYPRNTRALAAALKRTGHEVRVKFYPGVDHVGTLLAISRPLRDKAPVIDDVLDFFAAH